MLELSLLGGFEVRNGRGEAIALPTRKARALLAYLALHPDEAVSRPSLAALLWSDRAEPQANNSLSQAVSAIRKALAGVTPAPLVVDPDSLKIVGSAVAVDVLAFDELSKSSDPAELDRAEGLYRGELLEGVAVRDPAFEDWLEFERRRLHALAVGTLSKLLELRRQEGQRHDLVATAERLLKLDPLQESAHRALMRCYAEQAQVGLALGQYETCADILKRELGVEPDGDTERLREAILGQRSASSAAPAPPEASAPDAPAAERTAAPDPSAKRPLAWPLVAAGLAVLAVVAGTAFWQRPWEPREEPAAVENMAFPLPDKPSIAVLPFTNISDDPEQEYFADGMVEDLITDLSKISGLFVISRNTAFTYKGRSMKTRQVAEELGVRYVLEGSVRRASEQMRINAQLIDATTGGHLWAERYDGTLADVFALQDKVTERIVEALALELTHQEAQRVRGLGTDIVAAHDAYLLGLSYYNRRTPADNAIARDHFEQAIELDPNYSAAYTALAKVYLKVRGEAAYSEKLGIYWMAGYTRARRLLEKGMARPNADSHVLLSWLALRKRQYDRAIDEANRALELSPNNSDALEALAEALIYSGQPMAGIEVAERAMRQNPARLGRPLFLVGLAEFTLGAPQNAVEHLERALRHAPNQTNYADILAASYAELGRAQQAEAAFEILAQGLHYEDRSDLVRLVASRPISSRGVVDRLAEGLRVAGARLGISGYLPIYATNKLSGEEIKALLFGRKIEGTQITWQTSEFDWRQQRTADGGVEHFGYPVQPGVFGGATGTGRIEDDMLCERWPELSDILDICVVIYRIPGGHARIRWGDYVMVTDLGPQPFRLVE